MLVTVFTTLRLAVVNVYAVNGTESPYRDPVTGAVKGTRHHFKRSFHSRLVEECKRLEDAGLRVVVGGDVNIARGAIDGFPGIRLGDEHVRNRRDFNEKFFDGEEGLRAVDAWREMRGGERKYTYYPPRRAWGSSCDRVDMFILSRALVGAGHGQEGTLREVEIWDSVLERGSSDHVPLSVGLDLEMLSSRGAVSEGLENKVQSGKISQS